MKKGFSIIMVFVTVMTMLFSGVTFADDTNENTENKTGRELVVFRDSFASSFVPLLVEGYDKITLIDTRYISPKILSQYIEFNDQDILFLYSTSIINNSYTLK